MTVNERGKQLYQGAAKFGAIGNTELGDMARASMTFSGGCFYWALPACRLLAIRSHSGTAARPPRTGTAADADAS
jgi:hypothetical protein